MAKASTETVSTQKPEDPATERNSLSDRASGSSIAAQPKPYPALLFDCRGTGDEIVSCERGLGVRWQTVTSVVTYEL